MHIAIVNPIMKTLNYPEEKEPSERILSDSQTNIVELANAMQKLGHKITIFASDSFKPKKQSTSGAKIVYLKTRLRKLFFTAVLPFCPSLGKELKAGKFDAIIFNPPYLPTSKEEKLSDAENLAYDGGEDGRKTLDKFLNEFEKFLEPKGILLLVQSSLNNLEKTKKNLSSKGFSAEILDQKSFFFEKIYALRIKYVPK